MNQKMSQRPKVLQVIDTLNLAGAQWVVCELTKGLADREIYSLEVCCLREGGPWAQKLENLGFQVHILGKKTKYDLRCLLRFIILCRRLKPQVVHAHDMTAMWWGTLGAWLAGAPVIIATKHGRARLFLPTLGKKLMYKALATITDKIIAVSHHLKDYMIQHEGINPAKIEVILNGIDLSDFRKTADVSAAKKELGIPADNAVVGIIASLTPVKNHTTLIKAGHLIRQSLPKVTFLVIGDGPLMRQHQKLVHESGLADAFIFLGNREDVPSLLPVFDVSVLCSLYEGISITILESMAAGKPVVATHVGGTPEVVKDGLTGYLVPPENPKELAEKIRCLLESPTLAKSMGTAGREFVEREFSYARMIEETKQVYAASLRKLGLV